jgi:hypothetical protein
VKRTIIKTIKLLVRSTHLTKLMGRPYCRVRLVNDPMNKV